MELKYAQIEDFIEKVLPFHLNLRSQYPNTWLPFKQSEISHLRNGIDWLKDMRGNYTFIYIENNNNILCGCLVGFTNTLYFDELNTGFVGYFDALPDENIAVEKMLTAALGFLKENKIQQVFASFDFSIWHRYRFMSKGFDQLAFVSEPRNLPYYNNYFQKSNFEKYHSWNNYKIDLLEAEKILSDARIQMELFEKLGYRRIFVNATNAEICLKKAYHLFVEVYKVFPGYQHISESAFCKEYEGIEKILHRKSSFLVENEEGQTVAGIFVLKDVFESLNWMQGKSTTIAKLKFLIKQNRGNRAFIYQGAALTQASRKAAIDGKKLFGEALSIGRAGFAFSLQALLKDRRINEIQMVLTRPEAANVNYVKKTQEILSSYDLYRRKL